MVFGGVWRMGNDAGDGVGAEAVAPLGRVMAAVKVVVVARVTRASWRPAFRSSVGCLVRGLVL